jgi:hypothetical protein
MLLALSLVAVSSAFSADYDAKVAEALKLIEAGKNAEARDRFFISNPYTARMAESFENMKRSFADVTKDVGKFQYSTKVGEYKFADTIVLIEYLLIYDRQPVLLELKFFKKKDGWGSLSISLDPGIGDKVEENGERELIWRNSVKTKGPREGLSEEALKEKGSPNQPPLQTPTSGTPAAGAPVAPPPGAAGL